MCSARKRKMYVTFVLMRSQHNLSITWKIYIIITFERFPHHTYPVHHLCGDVIRKILWRNLCKWLKKIFYVCIFVFVLKESDTLPL